MKKNERSAPCGTEAAYNRHRRHGETPCQECKRAAAAARGRRRGVPEKVDTPMGEHVSDGPAAVAPSGVWGAQAEALDYTVELGRLYGVLGKAMEFAAPRETASIAREMRAILHDLRADKESSAQGPSLKEQLAEAKRERAARTERRKVVALASGDVEGLAEAEA